jgi:hypothetical protein
VHRGRAPTSGFIALDRDVVTADVDEFLERSPPGPRPTPGRRPRRPPLLLAADNLWRGPVFDGLLLIDDPSCQTRSRS